MNEITLEKIDIVRERFPLSYEEAKLYLEKADGNVVNALALVEKEDALKNSSGKDEILNKLKKLLEKGNVTKIVIRKDGEKFFEVPITVGLSVSFILGLITPVFLWVGILVGAMTSIKIEVVKEDGSVEEVNRILKVVGKDLKDKAGENMNVIKEKAGEMSDNLKSKAGEMSDNIKSKAGEVSDNIKSKADDLSENIKSKANELTGNIKSISSDVKDKTVDGVTKLKDQVQDKSAEAQDELKKRLSGVKDASGNMFGKLKDKMNVNNLKKEDNSFTYKVDFDDDQIKYNKENKDLNE
ncbi:MAG: DUF4342 domain-containing protein [Oscillospiraceae bacterium]|nr:DUF4342 domain-containing protein [Oscillospiraceae bacterium]